MIYLIILISVYIFGRCFWIKSKQSIYPRLTTFTHAALLAVQIGSMVGFNYAGMDCFYHFKFLANLTVFLLLCASLFGVELWAFGIRRAGTDLMIESEVIAELTREHAIEIAQLKKQISDYERMFVERDH